MKRIIVHWTAGGPVASALDKSHYHFLIQQDLTIVEGDLPPEANAGPLAGKPYAAHTLNCNTGSIGVSLCGMAGAVEAPFNPGIHPIKWAQVERLAVVLADLRKRYGIAIGRTTILSHAEVQPTLGIKQRGKWDIAWLPDMTKPGDPVAVGDRIRAMVR